VQSILWKKETIHTINPEQKLPACIWGLPCIQGRIDISTLKSDRWPVFKASPYSGLYSKPGFYPKIYGILSDQ